MTRPAPSASTRAAGLPRSGIRVMADLARRTEGALRLDIGDPDFGTPAHIVEAAARAAAEGFTHYGPSTGLPSLRDAIAADATARYGVPRTNEHVTVTVGGAGALSCALVATCETGDEVLLPDPSWANLVPMTMAAGATPSFYALDRSRGFEPDVEDIERRIGPRTRVLVLNSPGNPTGGVFSREAVDAVLELAERHGLWVLSDECYDRLVLDGEHVHVATAAADPARVVTVMSFSKTYAMTGWRLGHVIAAPEIASLAARVQEAVVSCPSTVVQKAGEAAITGAQDCVDEMRAAYARRRDVALAALDAGGVPYVRPRGAFYVMVDVSAVGEPSQDFAMRLLTEQQVATVAGSAFGPIGEGMLRVSFAASDEAIAEGMKRLAALVAERSA